MASIKPGLYTIKELVDLADFDMYAEAAADYNDSGYDLRRVSIGGLPIGSEDDAIRVPEGADPVEIRLDQEVVYTFEVE